MTDIEISKNADRDNFSPTTHFYNCISPDANVAQDCTIGAYVYIPPHTDIASGVRIENNVAFTGSGGQMSRIKINHGVTIGAGATLVGSITIGAGARILPGAVVTRDLPENAIVSGNPAAIIGYVDALALAPVADPSGLPPAIRPRITPTGVGSVNVHHFPAITDIRGSLTVGEFDREIPFVPLRYFMVFDVPSSETRGEHAHRECHQFLICVRGGCAVLVDDGSQRTEIALAGPTMGVHLPPMIWGTQYKYTRDAILLVFASHHYDSGDYIRRYDEFLAELRAR